jgi:hypothetical protein
MVTKRLARGMPLDWDNWPDYKQIEAVCEVVSHIRRPQEMGVASYSQLALFLNELRLSPTLKSFFHWNNTTYKGDPAKIDSVFKFLRAVEYSLPEYFAVVELMVKQAGRKASYGLFLAQMPRWFRAGPLKMLDEQGVPIQISERFLQTGDTVASLSDRLVELAKAEDDRLSVFERQWIIDALPDLTAT